MHTDFVLDALEVALFDRQPERHASLIHHSDRGSLPWSEWRVTASGLRLCSAIFRAAITNPAQIGT